MVASPELVKKFISNLTTTTGRWAGKPFVLHPFQNDWIDLIFETEIGPFGERRRIRREVVIGVGRKNGKTELLAAICLALLVCDGERGGLVIGAAAKRDQAKLMLETAKRMVNNSPWLSKFLICRRDHIYFPEMDATYKVIAAEAQKEHGLNPHAVVVDEGHATMETSRELYDTLLTAQGARENPIAIVITTAGPAPTGPMFELYEYGKQIQAGARSDPRFGFLWYESEPDAPVGDRAAWIAANPAFGLFLREEFLKDASDSVLNGKSPEFMFRRLHLNQWTTAAERWLPYSKVEQCKVQTNIPDGAAVWLAVDAAIKRDTMAVALVFQDSDGIAHCRVKRFLPTVGTGGYIDPVDVETYILGLSAQYSIQRISYDPAYMGMLASALSDRGMPMEPFPQSAQKMERASETLQRLVIDGRVRWGLDPEMVKQISSVTVRATERGVRISKSKTLMPIDMAVALAMALDDVFGEEGTPQDFVMFVQPNRSHVPVTGPVWMNPVRGGGYL